MQHRTMRVFAAVLVLLMLAGSFACTPKNDESMTALVQMMTQERMDLQNKLDDTQKELNEAKTEAANAKQALLDLQSAPTPEPVVVTNTETVTVSETYAYGVGCTVNGDRSVKLDDGETITAVADEIEGYVFDHWEINNAVQDITDTTIEFAASKTTLVRAVFHERHTLKCINCHFKFLDENRNAAGQGYKEFDFEEDYQNPVTEKTEKGGLMNFYVFAEVPRDQQVDYWLINNVKYQFPQEVTKFRIEGLNEATVIEVVLKGQAKQTSTPEKTPAPTKYYNVSCHNCKYKYDGAWHSSGKVPAGSQITISGTTDSTEAYFDGSPSSVNRHFTSPHSGSSGKWVFTYTYTVNSDTDVTFRGVVN